MGTIIGVAALIWCFLAWTGYGWHFGISTMADTQGYRLGTTIVLAGIMLGQLGTLLVVRSDSHATYSLRPGKNVWLLRALAVEAVLLLAIIYLPPLQMAFQTAAMPLYYWPLLFLIVPIILIVELLRRRLAVHREVAL
jgi:magnesium-transporting ATPase (P-type)